VPARRISIVSSRPFAKPEAPLHQLLDGNALVQELGKRRHHVGTRQQEAGLVHGCREDIGKNPFRAAGTAFRNQKPWVPRPRSESTPLRLASLRMRFTSLFTFSKSAGRIFSR